MSDIEKIKNRILELMNEGVLKTEALKKLHREFIIGPTKLNDLWIAVKQDKKVVKKALNIGDRDIPKEEIKVGCIKQSLDEANLIKPIERKFETKCGIFIKNKEGVTFEGLTFKSKKDIKYYRDIIDMADKVMDMEV